MEHPALTTYLNDHLAGSVAALELLDHLLERTPTPDAKRLYADLRADVTADQETLQGLLRQVGGHESGVRKVGAWLTEKAGRLKLRLDESANGLLYEFEAVEGLSLGILGKLALWQSLTPLADQLEVLRGLDLERLQQRALDQYSRAEARRRELARTLFQAPGPQP